MQPCFFFSAFQHTAVKNPLPPLDQVSGGWGKRVPLVPHKPMTSGGTEPEEDGEEEYYDSRNRAAKCSPLFYAPIGSFLFVTISH